MTVVEWFKHIFSAREKEVRNYESTFMRALREYMSESERDGLAELSIIRRSDPSKTRQDISTLARIDKFRRRVNF